MEEDIWKDAEVISSYTRAQAIEDGILVDLSVLAREAGFKYPVAVTVGVFALLAPWAQGSRGDVSKPAEDQPLYGLGQSFDGRAWDLLTILLYAIRRGKGGARVDFAPLFLMPGFAQDRPVPVQLEAICEPGDEGDPAITIMLAGRIELLVVPAADQSPRTARRRVDLSSTNAGVAGRGRGG